MLRHVASIIQPAARHVIIIGRIAGQYSKPRSSDTEVTREGEVVGSYRGDAINGYDVYDRLADPSRMLSAYWHAAATLNYMRMKGYVGAGGEGGGGGSSSSTIYTSHECLLLPMESAVTDAVTRHNQVTHAIHRDVCVSLREV
jgi:3-deoxy-D-arabino-heptulosonate 7-phosphate (DAHP) synthase class II